MSRRPPPLPLDDLFLCFLFALVRRRLQRDGAATSAMVISGEKSVLDDDLPFASR
jgi:hypothetical protein